MPKKNAPLKLLRSEYAPGTKEYAVMAAFSDCHGQLPGVERDLNFRSAEVFNADELVAVFRAATPDGYNNFDSSVVETLTKTFGEHAEYFPAREGSPCIYVRAPKDSRLWLDRAQRGVAGLLAVDEFSLESDGALRLWWD
jgi:hypothetical protein